MDAAKDRGVEGGPGVTPAEFIGVFFIGFQILSRQLSEKDHQICAAAKTALRTRVRSRNLSA